MHIEFWWRDLRERDHLKDPSVKGSKMDLQEVRWGVMDWIALAQDRDSRAAVVNPVINVRVP